MEQGETVALQTESNLSLAEQSEGYVYSCCRGALSDLLLDAEDLSEYNIPSTQILPSKIDSLNLVHSDLIKVCLRLPPGKTLPFLPGQYIHVMQGSIKRSYSLANSTSQQHVELFIRRYEGGAMSDFWFAKAKTNDLLRIEGPLGTFFIRHSKAKTLLLLATGTGIAPLKSILESQAHQASSFDRVILVWGVRKAEDLCWSPSTELLEHLEFIPVISRNTEWQGKQGHVQDIALTLNIDFSSCDVYACGNEKMIQQAKCKLVEHGLHEQHFYADSFLPSS